MDVRRATDKTLLSGLVFAAIGAGAMLLDRSYRLGTATAMGPGYFPFLISLVLIALGVTNVVLALRARGFSPLASVAVRPLVLLALGVLLFGVTIDRFGLLPAIACLVACSVAAGPRYRSFEVVAILLVLGIVAGSLFVFGLGLPAAYLVRR